MTSNLDMIGLRVGDLVRERDGRHLATVTAVFHWTVRVRWIETGWRSDLLPEEVELVEAAKQASIPIFSNSRPATIAESPRRRLERIFAARRGS